MTSEVLRKILVAGAAVAALSVVACNKPKDAAAASDQAAAAASDASAAASDAAAAASSAAAAASAAAS